MTKDELRELACLELASKAKSHHYKSLEFFIVVCDDDLTISVSSNMSEENIKALGGKIMLGTLKMKQLN